MKVGDYAKCIYSGTMGVLRGCCFGARGEVLDCGNFKMYISSAKGWSVRPKNNFELVEFWEICD